MTRATGGSAWAATSTRSRSFPCAYSSASWIGFTPSCPPFSSTSRTCDTRMSSLIRLCGIVGRVCSTRRRGLKGASPSCQLPPSSNNKTAAQQRPDPFQPSRLNLRQARGPGGEEHVRPCFAELHRSSLAKLRQQLVERFRGLLPTVRAHSDRVFRLLVAPDDDVRDLLHLRVADPLADRLVGVVDLDPELVQLLRERPGRVAVVEPDRDHPHLHRSEPDRECAAKVLDQDPHEALEGAEERSVN